jgi:protein SCO1/2
MDHMKYLSRRHLLAWSTSLPLGLALSACDRAVKPSFKSVDITGADYARTLQLPDADGQVRRLSDFKGKLVVIFFGYTQCPDVCPTTLSALVETKGLLGSDGTQLQGVFVTIDPERDTPQILKGYTGAFDPSFVALRGTAEETAAAAKEFKVYYRKAPGKTPESYTMDHTAAAYVLDTEGRPRLYVRHGMPPADLAADLKLLLAAS